MRKARLTAHLALPVLLAMLLGACWHVYSSEEIAGTVIDASTKAPLAGVHVLVYWPSYVGLEGGTMAGNVEVLETETDNAGKYVFPAWGPRLVDAGGVRTAAPYLTYFRSGYSVKGGGNNPARITDWWTGRMKSDWNGKTIELQRFEGSDQDYAKGLEQLDSFLWQVAGDRETPCDWLKMTGMIVAVETDRRRVVEAGLLPPHVDRLYSNLAANDDWYVKKCGQSPKSKLGVLK